MVLEQPRRGYRAAIDPVLLAAAITATRGQKILDLGCGAGAAMFCLAARVPGLSITGVELQPEYAACAEANIAHNNALGAFTIIQGDVRKLPRSIQTNSFDHVIVNPPFHDRKSHSPGPRTDKNTAQAMSEDDRAAWIKSAHGRLKHRGVLTMIYSTNALAALLQLMDHKFGGLAIIPLWPKLRMPAKRVIVRGVKDSHAPLTLLPGLILHDNDGDYTTDAENILRKAYPLPAMT